MDNTNKVEREVKTHYNNIASIITPNPFDFPFSIKKNFEGTVQLAIKTFCCITSCSCIHGASRTLILTLTLGRMCLSTCKYHLSVYIIT